MYTTNLLEYTVVMDALSDDYRHFTFEYSDPRHVAEQGTEANETNGGSTLILSSPFGVTTVPREPLSLGKSIRYINQEHYGLLASFTLNMDMLPEFQSDYLKIMPPRVAMHIIRLAIQFNFEPSRGVVDHSATHSDFNRHTYGV